MHAAVCLLLPHLALAASVYDPALTWATIESPRIAVHYPDGARNLALRVSRIAEEELDRVADVFGFAPEGRIEIVLSDASDFANGSAQVEPKNTLRLLLAAPTELTGLASYDDWLRILVIHELAHICDIDQTWGITRFLRAIFGKYIQMNGLTPQFLSEGVAVYAETLLTETGRGRSSFVEMILRTAALDGEFLPIDRANVLFSDWPGPIAAYFYGGRFHLWLAQRYGKDKVRALHQFNAANPIPYIYWLGAVATFGKSLPALWAEWSQDEVAYARDVRDAVLAAGATISRRITMHGRNITGSRYSPDGQYIVYSRSSPVDGATVRRIGVDGRGDRHLVLETYSPRFSFSPDGRYVYYSQNAINARFNDYADLYRYDLEAEQGTRLRDVDAPDTSLRARDPDVSPDGGHIVFVQNRLHQSWVTTATMGGEDGLRMRVLVPPSGDVQYASPRFSPDGARVAVSVWADGQRDIVVVDAQSGALVERVTDDRALDGSPAWSPDGRYVLYESDLDGISNIYAYDTRERRRLRVTRVIGGAYQPEVSPDSSRLLFRNASGIGFDIHEMPYDPARWSAVDVSVPDAPRSLSPKSVRADEPPLSLRLGEGDHPYRVSDTLLPFQHNWVLFPAVYSLNGDPTVRLATVGQDALAEHTYVLSAGTSYHGGQLDWSAQYINDMTYPTLFAGGGMQTVNLSTSLGEWVSRRDTYLGTAFGLPVGQRHGLGASLQLDRRVPRDALAEQLLGGTQDFSHLQFGYAYRFARRFPYSVSDEHGVALALGGRWYSEALGADFDEVLLTLDGRGYINNPLFDNHVLALRLVSALALGPDYEERFILGGAQGASFLTVQTEQVYGLRGFASNVDVFPPGTGVLAAYAEYRFPLWHIEHGLWTLPFYIERLHGALFVDAGNTFGNGSEADVGDVVQRAWRRLRGGRLGAGAEVRLDVALGWAFPLTSRLGIAWPLMDRGLPVAREPVVYGAFGAAL